MRVERLEVRQVGLPEDMQVVLTEHLVKCMLIILQHTKWNTKLAFAAVVGVRG